MVREVLIVVHDDLDGSDGAETYPFAWGGVEYEIDLNEAHFKEWHEIMRPLLDAARRQGSAPKPPSSTVSTSRRTTQLKRVRKWAREQGYDVRERGLVAVEIQERFNEAHPTDQIPIRTTDSHKRS